MKITALLDALNSTLAEPFALAWSQDSPRFLLVFTVIYAVVLIVAVSDQKNTRPGAEHGSAAWGDVFRLNKFYMDKRGPNLLLTQHFHIGIDGYKHKHNTNILIVGGSGAGKTRTYGVPNVLECACSMVITDPKAEILRKTGNLLKQKGYEVIIFDLINPTTSFCYNPFVYVQDDKDVLSLISNLIQNTTPSHSQSSDPFWEKSETALLQALMLLAANFTDEVAAQINGILHSIQTGESIKPNLQEQLEQTQQEFDRLLEMSLDFDEDTPFLDNRLKKLNNKIKSLKKAIEDSAARQEKARQPEMLLSAKDLQILEYDDALTARIIEKITVRSRSEIEIRFIGGYKKTMQLT